MNTLHFNTFLCGYSSVLPDDILLEIYVKALIIEYGDKTIDYLCSRGNISVIEYINNLDLDIDLGWGSSNMDIAAGGGHLDLVKWLSKNRTEGCTTAAMDLAAMNGHFDVVKWLSENSVEGCTSWAMDDAAEGGHLEVIIFLHETLNIELGAFMILNATKKGHLHVLMYLYNKRWIDNQLLPVYSYIMRWAAIYGHLHIIKWLYENKLNTDISSAIAEAFYVGNSKLILSIFELDTDATCLNKC